MIPSLPSILTAFGSLVAVLGLIWLASRATRLGGLATRRTGSRVLGVEEAIALDPRRQLTLIRCDGRRVLLLTGGGQDVVVGWLPDAAP